MNILLVGGSGFVGSAIAARLARAGHRIAIPTRNRERAKHLLVLPTAEVIDADIHDPATLGQLVRGRDAVINLVGILKGGEGEPYGAGFARAHVDLPKKIAHAVQESGVPRLLHMSALAADAQAPSGYLRSKAAGEAAAFAVAPPTGVTVFRPSVIFGRGDSFLTLFARLLAIAPFVPLAGADARFQPVWVGDVAAAFVAALDHPESAGRAYDLGGPKTYALRDLVAYAGKLSGHPRTIVGLPYPLAWLQARAMEFIPNGPMTRDNLRSMQVPSVCPAGCAFPFGIQPTALEDIAPGYLAP
jgi:NADH dehydrogenase